MREETATFGIYPSVSAGISDHIGWAAVYDAVPCLLFPAIREVSGKSILGATTAAAVGTGGTWILNVAPELAYRARHAPVRTAAVT